MGRAAFTALGAILYMCASLADVLAQGSTGAVTYEMTADGQTIRLCPEGRACTSVSYNDFDGMFYNLPRPVRLTGPSLGGRGSLGRREYTCDLDGGVPICRPAATPRPGPARNLMMVEIAMLAANRYDVHCRTSGRGADLSRCYVCFVHPSGQRRPVDICFPSTSSGVVLAGPSSTWGAVQGNHTVISYACGDLVMSTPITIGSERIPAQQIPCTDGAGLRRTAYSPVRGGRAPETEAASSEEGAASGSDAGGFTFETE